jgi:hypothetical protein
LAHFQKEDNIQRIAFIWEVTTSNNKISDIRVVYDGANPMMNEQKAISDYRNKYQKNILVPKFFPFEVTHVDSKVIGNNLTISYKNATTNSVIEVNVTPKSKSLDQLKGRKEKLTTLKSGRKVLSEMKKN